MISLFEAKSVDIPIIFEICIRSLAQHRSIILLKSVHFRTANTQYFAIPTHGLATGCVRSKLPLLAGRMRFRCSNANLMPDSSVFLINEADPRAGGKSCKMGIFFTPTALHLLPLKYLPTVIFKFLITRKPQRNIWKKFGPEKPRWTP